jgi:hypothetical protein
MRIILDTSHHSQPEGGWSYPVPDGPTLTSPKVGAPGLKEVIKQMKDYRVANGLPVGDPEHEIAMHYAPSFPWLVKESADLDEPIVKSEAWIHQTWKSPSFELAEIMVREDRFEQCEGCPFFEPLKTETLTPEANRRLILMNPAKERKEHGWCRLRGWICSVAVQVRNPSRLTNKPDEHSECWLASNL